MISWYLDASISAHRVKEGSRPAPRDHIDKHNIWKKKNEHKKIGEKVNMSCSMPDPSHPSRPLKCTEGSLASREAQPSSWEVHKILKCKLFGIRSHCEIRIALKRRTKTGLWCLTAETYEMFSKHTVYSFSIIPRAPVNNIKTRTLCQRRNLKLFKSRLGVGQNHSNHTDRRITITVEHGISVTMVTVSIVTLQWGAVPFITNIQLNKSKVNQKPETTRKKTEKIIMYM